MKQEIKQEQHQISEYENNCHLWNLVPGGSGKGIVMLRKIVDAIQNDNYSNPWNENPTFLITGVSGKKLATRALINSLAIEDYRVCPGRYFENGYYSHQFFRDSFFTTAHIITNIDKVQARSETTLWKYLNDKECTYFNSTKRSYDSTTHCNGIIVMTAQHKDMVSDTILKATDYVIELDPLNSDQLLAVTHQRLVFCGVNYNNSEEVLKAIIKAGLGEVEFVIPFLEKCLVLMKAEMLDCLDLEVVKKADRLFSMSVPPVAHKTDIPL
jgi:hypothetical protein